ncbi:MAG: ABC transporter substrate binding protein [Vicinamibacteria bacterium]
MSRAAARIRLRLVAAAAVCWLSPPAAGAADVVILKSAETPAWRPVIDALRKAAPGNAFSELDLRADRAEAARVAGSLKGRPVVLVAMGPLAAAAAREAFPAGPLVVCMVPDAGPLLGPGIGGVGFAVPVKNQLAAFRLVNPRAVRVGVIHSEPAAPVVQEAQRVAASVRLTLEARQVASVKDVPGTLRALLSGSNAVDAFWIPSDPLFAADDSRRFLLTEVTRAGKPVYASAGSVVPEGALVGSGPDLTSIGALAGDLVNRLVAGEKGRMELLVPRAELVVNKKMASRLGIELSPDALKAATRTF